MCAVHREFVQIYLLIGEKCFKSIYVEKFFKPTIKAFWLPQFYVKKFLHVRNYDFRSKLFIICLFFALYIPTMFEIRIFWKIPLKKYIRNGFFEWGLNSTFFIVCQYKIPFCQIFLVFVQIYVTSTILLLFHGLFELFWNLLETLFSRVLFYFSKKLEWALLLE